MSSSENTVQYTALDVGDKVQNGDQWLDEHGQWQSYVFLAGRNGVVGYGVRARRPIPATGQVTYEEVPGSRTTQETVVQPQRERIAYEELQQGDIIQEGDEWQTDAGRWKPFASLNGSQVQVRHSQRTRRPHNITMMLAEFANQAEVLAEVRADEERLVSGLELLRSEYDKLQNERDELKTALRESHAAHEFTMKQGPAVCKERDEACRERDLARSEAATLSTELWARKPLEGRVASLTEELAQARAELQRLQEAVGNLYNEPTARQVQQMLRTWATELDWSAGCFDSVGRDEIDTIQKTLVAVIERIESIINPEGGSDGE